MSTGCLEGIRILDLSGPAGYYCTKLFADLGADVVLVEAPDRDAGEGSNDDNSQTHMRRSLARRHYHTNKRSVAIDVALPDDREKLRRLAGAADALIHTFRPSEAEAMGLDPDTLIRENPSLVVTTITGFGWFGARRDFKVTDIVGQAMGGLLSLTGFPEKTPYQLGAEQAYHMASLHAATGTLVALSARDADGAGRHVDISIQDAVSLATLQTANLNYYLREGVVRRRGALMAAANPARAARAPVGGGIQRCKDGWISFTIPPGHWRDFVRWLEAFGVHEFSDPKYEDPEVQASERARVIETQTRLFNEHTVNEIYHSAQRHRLLAMPVQDVSHLLADEQLAERGFFVQIDHPEMERTLTYPGAPYKLSKTPWELRRRAPEPGEDMGAVLREWLGVRQEEVEAGATAGRAN